MTPKLTKRRPQPKQGETADYAGLGRRLLAFVYDYILIAIYIGVIVGMILFVPPLNGFFMGIFTEAVPSDIAAFLLLILPVILYFGLSEGSARASTWGKRRVGLRVVSKEGKPIGVGRALLRSGIKFLPWQFGHTAVFQSLYAGESFSMGILVLFTLAYGLAIAYLIYLWRRPDHRTPYDLLAGTVVITPRASKPGSLKSSRYGTDD
jgi:uncharacterized RDD family membrane protein YckC